MLTNYQRAQRKRQENARRSIMLCARLDRHVIAGETYKPGSIMRARHLAIAELTREELRKIDH